MQTTKFEPLIPSEGMVLTNGEIYSSEVYLGKNDSPDNWWEITREEYEGIMAKQVNRKDDIYEDIY